MSAINGVNGMNGRNMLNGMNGFSGVNGPNGLVDELANFKKNPQDASGLATER